MAPKTAALAALKFESIGAAREKGCLRCKKPGLLLGATGMRGPLEVSKMLWASSHYYVADIGGTCCWLSGSDAKRSIGHARWWHIGTKDKGIVTFSLR